MSSRHDKIVAPTDFSGAGRPGVHSSRVFSEPVTVISWGDRDKLDKLLARLILTTEKCEPGLKRSNNGGWHSQPNFFKSSSPEIEELKRRIVFALSATNNKLKKSMYRDGLAAGISRAGQMSLAEGTGTSCIITGRLPGQVSTMSKSAANPDHPKPRGTWYSTIFNN